MIDRLRRLSPPLLYLPVCLGVDWLGHLGATPPLHITHWNPASALGVILLLKFGPRGAFFIFAASLIAELSFRGAVAPLPYLVFAAAAPAAIYCGAILLLQRVVGFDSGLTRFRDLAWFVAAAFAASLLTAAVYVGSYTLAGSTPSADFVGNLVGYWFDEFIGVLVLAPLLLVHWHWRRQLAGFRLGTEHLLQIAALLLVLWAFVRFEISDDFMFLPLVWIAMRHGIHGTTLAVLAIQIVLVQSLKANTLPTWSVAEFHFLMASLAFTGLALGVVVSERQRVSAMLHARDADLALAMRVVGAGELASSLAHELNQPLSASQNYTRACRLILERSPPDLTLLGVTLAKLQAEVSRAGDAVRHLRSFYQGGSPKTEPHALPRLVAEALRNAAGQTERADIEVVNRVGGELPAVRIDPIQILIVLHNLVVNAAQSLAAAGTTPARIDIDAELGSDGLVRVCVGDNGPGIADEVRERLFVTVATTKSDGMGLGLMICRSLVEGHGGKLWLDAWAPGKTRFCFTLPPDDSRPLPPELPAELH